VHRLNKISSHLAVNMTAKHEAKNLSDQSEIGLIGLAVMGQNLALNIAEKGFKISVWNRSPEKVDATVKRAKQEKVDKLVGYKDFHAFVQSLRRPRAVIIMIQAGAPVDQTIEMLRKELEPGDLIVDGGNEWFENTERRAKMLETQKIMYMGMGVSGGEDGARHGPSLMTGGPIEGYKRIEPILIRIAAQARGSGPCVTYIGPGGAGNYVKMIHNGIEYGDMQLIAETYDILKNVGGLSNPELHTTFSEWNKTELESFLVEITAIIFARKDDYDHSKYAVDMILDRTGSKGTGKWTVQQAAELGVPAPTMSSSLDARYLSSLLEERVAASMVLKGPEEKITVDRQQLIADCRYALYAAKICSYAQGMNLIRIAGINHHWNLNLGEISRIWKGGCIIRAVFLDRITAAYTRTPNLPNLLIDAEFAREINTRSAALRRVVSGAIRAGICVPSFSASLAYFDSYRRRRLPANLTQAQRDFFGAHGYERIDRPLVAPGVGYHTEWAQPVADQPPAPHAPSH